MSRYGSTSSAVRRGRTHGLGLLCLIVFAGAAEGRVTAERLDAANLEALRVGGPQAIGGLGDWALGNGTLCAIVSDPAHESGLSATGGWLVDLGHCGAGDDQFVYLHLLPAMDRSAIPPAVAIRTERTEDSASIVVERAAPALQMQQRYTLRAQDPQALTIETRLRRAPGSARALPMFEFMWLHPYRALSPFLIDTHGGEYSRGFTHPRLNPNALDSVLAALAPAELSVLVSGDARGKGIGYGVQMRRAAYVVGDRSQPLFWYSLTQPHFTTHEVFAASEWLSGAAPADATLVIEHRIIVVRGGYVAAVTDGLYRGPWVRGRVDQVPARLSLYTSAGKALTETVAGADGRFAVRLPEGVRDVSVSVRTATGEITLPPVALSGKDVDLGTVQTPAGARVRLPRGTPMRVVITGLAGTPDPRFGSDLTDFRVGDVRYPHSMESNDIDLAGTPDDPTEIMVPAGRYRVFTSRGIEFGVGSAELELSAGASIDLPLSAPERELDLSQWSSADFHVHSGYSFDSGLTAEARLRAFIAQGADVLVATEHDNVVDPAAWNLPQLTDKLHIITGVELTGMAHAGAAPRTIGHVNAYPLVAHPEQFAGGMPLHEGRRLRDLLLQLRARKGAVSQLNHPRNPGGTMPDPDLAFFEHLSVGRRFDPAHPLDHGDNALLVERGTHGLRDLDFEVLEVANGGSLELYRAVRADWVSLILQDEYRPGVANSDSHHRRDVVAMPRTYVAWPRSNGWAVDAFIGQVRRGRAFGSSGPIPLVSLRGAAGAAAGIGERISGRELTLHLQVLAASWVPVDRAVVYWNGHVLHDLRVERGQTLELPVTAAADGFVFVELYGRANAVYGALAPGYTPMAFTNPIWVDANADGRWDRPGLEPVPKLITEPMQVPPR